MSGSKYDTESANDTFLSRVFGLHSIYNRLHDNSNYNYYESSLKDRSGAFGSSRLLSSSPYHNSDLELGLGGKPQDKNLLDSASDSDLSSDSENEPPRPAVLPNPTPNVNWDTDLNRVMESSAAGGHGRAPAGGFAKAPVAAGCAAAAQGPLHHKRPNAAPPLAPAATYTRRAGTSSRMVIPPKERALYLWANIVNMDEFLIDIYYYYRGKGFSSIVLGRVVDVFVLVFILWFTTFLTWGIDYDLFFSHWSRASDTPVTLKDLVVPNYVIHRVPFSVKFLLLGFACYIALRLLQLYFDYTYKLAELSNFYKQLLNIPNDLELMTISWSTIVERLMLLKDYNTLTSTNPNVPPHFVNDLNSKVRLNAHDIANRIMRKENYMIALINKDILDLSIPAPGIFQRALSSKSVLTRTLEWNIKLCINNFVFNESGQINKNILKEATRNSMAQELSSRFKMAAIINLILCPFIVVYFVLLYFFRYFNEYKSNPSSLLGLRQYTPWAEWKLREFNELSHFFIKRLHLSVGPANTYINQFPGSVYVVSAMGLVNFMAGAFMAVLVIMGLFFEDEEHSFWSFELTEGRSTLFYISIFGTIWAVTSNAANTSTGTNSAENLNTHGVSFFYDPEASLRYVSQFTHYLPSSWNGKLHTVEVKNKFCELYNLKIVIIIHEILSLVLTPFVLWFRISQNSSAIIDFFREYTIHVDGLGYVCYFAMFNFEEKDKNMMHELNKKRRVKPSRSTASRKAAVRESSDESDDDELHDYYQDDKMIKSYMYFLESYGNQPQKEKASGRSAPRSRAAEAGPAASIVLTKRHWAGGDEGQSSKVSDSLRDLSYNFPERIEDSVPREKGRKGVLGMINQFSKQEAGR